MDIQLVHLAAHQAAFHVSSISHMRGGLIAVNRSGAKMVWFVVSIETICLQSVIFCHLSAPSNTVYFTCIFVLSFSVLLHKRYIFHLNHFLSVN